MQLAPTESSGNGSPFQDVARRRRGRCRSFTRHSNRQRRDRFVNVVVTGRRRRPGSVYASLKAKIADEDNHFSVIACRAGKRICTQTERKTRLIDGEYVSVRGERLADCVLRFTS